jgi:hypothetical protein
MRMTALNGIPLTGCTYTEVLEKVNRLPRPLRIKFADITRGIVVRVALWWMVVTSLALTAFDDDKIGPGERGSASGGD